MASIDDSFKDETIDIDQIMLEEEKSAQTEIKTKETKAHAKVSSITQDL